MQTEKMPRETVGHLFFIFEKSFDDDLQDCIGHASHHESLVHLSHLGVEWDSDVEGS